MNVRKLSGRVSFTSAFSLLALALGTSVALGATEWTQFRLNDRNNAVVGGDLRASWVLETGGPFSSSPTVVDGILYIGNNKGKLVALDVRSGKLLWTQHVSNPLMAEPLVIGNAVIVGEGNEYSDVHSGVVHVGSGDSALRAFDRTTGRPLWSVPLNGTGMPTPALVGSLLLEHSGSGDLYAIDPANGTVKYQRKVATIPSMVAALPLGKFAIVSGGQTDTSVVAIRASDGQTLWQQEFPNASGIGDCPAVSDGTRVFCNYVRPVAPATFVQVGTSVTEHAYALDAVTGQPVWDVALEVGKAPTRNLAAIPLLDGGTLFFGNSTAPWMHALDAETGKVRWRTHVRGPVKGGVVAVGGAVYFGDHGGYLWALDEQTGHVIGVKNMHTPFNVGSPLVVGRTLVIGSLTGRLIAVPLDVIRSAHDPAVKAPAEKP